MDQCKEIKDLILTDHIDGELDKEMNEQMDAHLLVCLDCCRFAAQAQKDLVAPFKKAIREEVPQEVWLAIKEKIQEEREGGHAGSFLSRWFQMGALPRLVPVLGSFVLVILMASTVFHNRQIKHVKEQGEYLVYLLGPADISQDADNNISETPIEKYFL